MIYPGKIKKGATVGIVCLSSGVLGEPFVKHEIKLIEERLPKEFGLKFKYMPNALKGEEFSKKSSRKESRRFKVSLFGRRGGYYLVCTWWRRYIQDVAVFDE